MLMVHLVEPDRKYLIIKRTGYKLSDMLSKHWDHLSVYNMIMKLLITRGPITLIPKEATQDKST